MYVLSLNISRLLNACLMSVLSDDKEMTLGMCISNGEPKPFNRIKRIILSELNKFYRLVAKRSLEFDL